MTKISYIIAEHPNSFGSFGAFSDALRRVKELCYAGVEMHLSEPAGFEVDELLRLVESIDLPVVSFMTGAGYFSEGLCLSSPRAEVRERAVARLSKCAATAARFGAVIVVGQMQGFLSDEPDRVVGEARITEGMKRVTEAAEQHGATIAFEPVNHLQAGFNNSLAEVMALASKIGSPRFKPMLDSFHMNIEEKSLTEPIQRVGRELAHFHLCESNGNVLGSGHLDVKPMLDALDAIKYPGYVSLKIYRQPWAVGAEASVPYLKAMGVM
jgi:sugar phosphate isomerase/epimerase